jgi:hypothetical protein
MRTFSTKQLNRNYDLPIYISENLTSYGNNLFKLAREFRKKFNYKICLVLRGL